MPPKPSEPQQETSVWREGPGDFRYEVTHPAGYTASGTGFKSTKSAENAAALVHFEPQPPDDQAAGETS